MQIQVSSEESVSILANKIGDVIHTENFGVALAALAMKVGSLMGFYIADKMDVQQISEYVNHHINQGVTSTLNAIADQQKKQ